MSGAIVSLGNTVRQLAKYGEDIQKAAQNGKYKAGVVIKGETQKKIQKVSPGSRPVVRYRDGSLRNRFASPLGGPPNTDTGTLVRSGEVIKTFREVYVQFRTEYAFELEMTRPYLVPTFKENIPLIKKYIEQEIRKA